MWGRQKHSTQSTRQPKFNQRGWPNTLTTRKIKRSSFRFLFLFLHFDIQNLHRATPRKNVVYNRVFLFEKQFFSAVFKPRTFSVEKKLASFLFNTSTVSFALFMSFSSFLSDKIPLPSFLVSSFLPSLYFALFGSVPFAISSSFSSFLLD